MEPDLKNTILIYTDGASSGNPGPGGFGTIVVFPEGKVLELGERRTSTTNNRMEMLAIVRGLESIPPSYKKAWVLTDSTYAIQGITQWIHGWKKRGWKNSTGQPVSNQDLWQDLDLLVHHRSDDLIIEWKYVRGHNGNPGNERCDEIAVAFSKRKSVDLYEGSLLQYPIAVHDFPENMELPPPRSQSKSKSKKTFSYLSYVNGELLRHSHWKDCEARVKGRPGAKFKKSFSSEDEEVIAKNWGLNIKNIKDS